MIDNLERAAVRAPNILCKRTALLKAVTTMTTRTLGCDVFRTCRSLLTFRSNTPHVQTAEQVRTVIILQPYIREVLG
jgi:hypothetical protein